MIEASIYFSAGRHLSLACSGFAADSIRFIKLIFEYLDSACDATNAIMKLINLRLVEVEEVFILRKIVFSLLGSILAFGMMFPALAREVSGKVLAVYLEPVTLNNKVMDKVSVSVKSCTSGQWETLVYSPGFVSDENSLGYLYNNLSNAARSVVSKNQYMNSVSGYVTLVVNEQNTIQKTTFWGYNWECGQDIEGKAASAPATGNSAPASPSQPKAQPSAPSNPLGAKFRQFGF